MSTQRYAVIAGGEVVNLILADMSLPEGERFAPANGQEIVQSDEAEIGWSYDGETFTAPEPAPIEAHPATVVTARQARLALLSAGLLDDVETALEGAPREHQIEWEYATEFRRDHPTFLAVAGLLGMNEEQIDALFAAAAEID